MKKKILVLGLGVSGKAVAAYLEAMGRPFLGMDREIFDVDWDEIDFVVKSPGVPKSHPVVQAAVNKGVVVRSEIDLALEEVDGKRLIGITGSMGKTTTTLLTAHVLGDRAIAVGNVGEPLISHVKGTHEILVVELSSFQLESIEKTEAFDLGAILNIYPNHLDRHPTMEVYARAKGQLLHCLKGSKWCTSKEVMERYGHLFPMESSPYFLAECEPVAWMLPHDGMNVAAAHFFCRQLGVCKELFWERVKTFQKPPHRCEFVRTFEGVTYVNDSKGTTPEAVCHAIRSVKGGRITLIAGGIDKGGDFTKWIPLLYKRVNRILVLGEARGRIQAALAELPLMSVKTLEEAVEQARAISDFGDTVLLSPGCSSFDQFQSYEHRGEVFKQLVNALGES